jgi:hypothetical protein
LHWWRDRHVSIYDVGSSPSGICIAVHIPNMEMALRSRVGAHGIRDVYESMSDLEALMGGMDGYTFDHPE